MIDKCLIIIFCLISFQVQGQIWDDFSDGEMQQNPVWSGDTGSYRVTQDYWLQLNAPAAGSAYIRTVWNPEELGEGTALEWGISLRLMFSPSANNLIRWYLWRSVQEAGLPGYKAIYIQVGENGSEDGIDLFYEEGGSTFKWIDGISGTMIATENEANIRVYYRDAGNWEILAATGGSEWMRFQGSAAHPMVFASGYTGIQCVFTSSNINRFYVDDYYAGPIRSDTQAPEVVSGSMQLPRSLEIHFSEVMDSISLQDIDNYQFSFEVRNKDERAHKANFALTDDSSLIQAVDYQDAYPRRVRLILEDDLESNLNYSLRLIGMKDSSQNEMKDTALQFFWHSPEIFDILLTEIMADPSPPVGLPEVEYVEFYNASQYPVSMVNWTFSIGSREIQFPDYQLDSKRYLVVCTEGSCPSFGPFIDCLDLFSSSSLPNTGSAYVLKDSLGLWIDFGEYSPDWHSGTYQSEGGFSLEMVDWKNPCGGKDNWASSRHELGGTPGTGNSVFTDNPDIQMPLIQRIYWIDSLSIGVFFTESILLPTGYDSLKNSRFLSEGGFVFAGEEYKMYIDSQLIAGFQVLDWVQKHLVLRAAGTLAEDKPHEFRVEHLMDCVGNFQEEQRVVFQKPSRADPGDLVINELLFNPLGEGVDYIELYNASGKVLDLSELLLAGMNEANQPEEVKGVAVYSYLLFPGSFAVLSADPEVVMLQFPVHAEASFVLPAVTLPSMPNDSGVVVLLDKTMQVLDRVDYRESQHFALLRSYEGVSLEKLSPELSGMDAASWFSAAEDVGFGTPGLPNSQLRQAEEPKGLFSLEYPAFSPNMDGYHDLLVMQYSFPETGYIAEVQVYNADGLRVRVLNEERFLSMRGQICWDGLDDSGLDLPVGLYFLVVRYYHPTGGAGRDRLDCALVRAGG